MILYSKTNPALLKSYNTFVRTNRAYLALPRLKLASFPFHYGRLRKVYKQMFPWQFVRDGDTVVQVSTAKNLIHHGTSHALILAALVGPRGKVFVIEPDPTNVIMLKAYLVQNNLHNVEVIEKAVWNEQKNMSFTVREERSSWNRISDTVIAEDAERHKDQATSVDVQADTFDNIARDHKISGPSLVHMSINGSEYEALQGMNEFLARDDAVLSFPIQNMRAFDSPILSELQERGFDILVKHAPVGTHQKQFLLACALKNPSHEILRQFPEEVELTRIKKDGRDFILITSKTLSTSYDDWVFRKQVVWF